MKNKNTISSSNLSDSLPNIIEEIPNQTKSHRSEKYKIRKNNFEKHKTYNNKQNSLIEFSSIKKHKKRNRKKILKEEILSFDEKIKKNEKDMNEIKKQLISLKQEKKKKKEDIINLLSNKESIEEIYKNQIYFLVKNINIKVIFNDEINHDKEININQENSENENINKSKNIIKNINDVFKIELNDIKESDKDKFIEQINNMIHDIFKDHDSGINNEIEKIINNSYRLIYDNKLENNDDLAINDFFTKLSLYISNQSLGKFQDSKINLLLRYLLKINTITKKLGNYIKFVNKKYKEKKKELNNSYNDLEKKNDNLKERKNNLEKYLRNYEEKESYKFSNSNLSSENIHTTNMNNCKEKKIIYSKKNISKINNVYKNSKTNRTNENKNNSKNSNIENKEKKDNTFLSLNEKLNNAIINTNIPDNSNNKKINIKNKIEEKKLKNKDVIIEYEDGIDKNMEINYEDDIDNQYNYDKENELIKKGINPYTNERIITNPNGGIEKENINNNCINIYEEKKDNNQNIKSRKNGNIVYLKEKREYKRRALFRKINDYTFNISINNNKNIFTENNSKNNNIENLKEKIFKNKSIEAEKNEINNKRKNEINFAKKINSDEKSYNDKEEIITYKISSINKNKFQEISSNKNNLEDKQKSNIFQKYKSKFLMKSNDNKIKASRYCKYKNDNCLNKVDEQNHNYISIINITNNAPIQNKSMNIGDDEKIYNIENFENDNFDEMKINNIKIKNNILNKIEENNDFDINNNNIYLKKETEKKVIDIPKINKNINIINKSYQNSKSQYKNNFETFINKNSEINDINGKNLKNKNLSINISSINNDITQLSPKLHNSNLTKTNRLLSYNNNIFSLRKNTQFDNGNSFFNNINTTTLKITKTKEVKIKDIKHNKLNNIFNISKLSKSFLINNLQNGKKKLFVNNSRDKIQIQGEKIKTNDNKIDIDYFNRINNVNNSRGKLILNKISKNNLSFDNLKKNKNQIKPIGKLSSNVIQKLKLINLPIPKNKNLKLVSNINKKNNFYNNKKINDKYTYFQYIQNNNFEINNNICMTKQSICYYRIFNKNNVKVNLQENISSNLEKIGFSKGYISVILKSDLLQFIPKINNNNEISIILKNIIGIQIEQYMKNIIDLTNRSKNNEENSELKKNKYLFNLLVSDFEEGKIECIFDSFEIYMFWMKFFEQISEYYRNCQNNFNFKYFNNN